MVIIQAKRRHGEDLKLIRHLFKIRKEHKLMSRAWLKSWCKRLYRSPQLVKIEFIALHARLRGASIGDGSLLESLPANTGLNKLSIGSNTFIAKNVSFALHNEIHIGNNVVINFGAKILTASHSISSEYWEQYSRPVTIHDYAWIAADSLILPGVEIGEGAVIGAGSVVRNNVEAYSVVAGNPATPLPKSRCTGLFYNPCSFNSAVDAWVN